LINVNLLPHTLRRRKGLDPWRAAAVAVPLLTLLVCGFVQLQASGQQGRLSARNRDLTNEKAVLQPFVDEQNALEAERAELAEVQGVAAAVRSGRIFWSRQLFAMLETRPTPGPELASRLAFTALEMRALDAATQEQLGVQNTYEGLPVVAEMSVSGVAGSDAVIADYLRELQEAPNFAVSLSDLARDPETQFYGFNLTIGAASLEPQPEAANDASQQAGPSTVQTEPAGENLP
jgi:Tfp pilus assembly protein PilN